MESTRCSRSPYSPLGFTSRQYRSSRCGDWPVVAVGRTGSKWRDGQRKRSSRCLQVVEPVYFAGVPGRKERFVEQSPVDGGARPSSRLTFFLGIAKALPEWSFPLSNWIGAH